MRNPILDLAIARAGSVKALAECIGIRPQSIAEWHHAQVPALRAVAIERATGIPRYELRPDLWEPPSQTDAAA